MSSGKHEFASEEWFEAARQLVQAKLDAAPPETLAAAEFSMCEVYTDVPPHLSPDGRLSWHLKIKDGQLIMLREESDDVILKVVADYETILPFARAPMAEMAEPALQEHMVKANAEGKVSFSLNGVPTPPPGFEAIHDEFAAFTK